MASVITQIADLWTPQIWIPGVREAVIQAPAFLNSGVVVTDPTITEVASGPGVEGNIPFIVEPDLADQVQIEDQAPDTKKLGSGLQKCAILNRVSPTAATALAKAISGSDPLKNILDTLANVRMRQRNKVVLAQLNGLYGTASAPGAATGVFRALRLDSFLEAGASPAAQYLIDSDMMLDALALAGEVKERFTGGAVIMHSKIESALAKQEQIDVIRNSQGEIVLRQWKGLQVFVSDLLTRAGGTSGSVYNTFFCARGSIAMGEKPQVAQVGEVASLLIDLTQIAKNNVTVYDRTRYILHPQGAKWIGTPALTGGADNTELATAGNWALAFSDIKNVAIVCLRTNG